jgi:nicotinamide mononucleotide transporter
VDFSNVLSTTGTMIQETSFAEWMGVSTSIIYLLLATYEKRSCWYFAFTSSILYVYLSFVGQLYVDSVLNIFYALMAVYGWFLWNQQNGNVEKQIHKLALKWHLQWLTIAVILGGLTGWILEKYTDQAYPFIDSIAFYLSILATWMTTKKVLENWMYFVLIDLTMIFIYFNRGYYLTSFLFLAYTLLALRAFFTWRKVYLQQQN